MEQPCTRRINTAEAAEESFYETSKGPQNNYTRGNMEKYSAPTPNNYYHLYMGRSISSASPFDVFVRSSKIVFWNTNGALWC